LALKELLPRLYDFANMFGGGRGGVASDLINEESQFARRLDEFINIRLLHIWSVILNSIYAL